MPPSLEDGRHVSGSSYSYVARCLQAENERLHAMLKASEGALVKAAFGALVKAVLRPQSVRGALQC